MFTFEEPYLLLLLLPVAFMLYLTRKRLAEVFPVRQHLLILLSRFVLFTLIIAALAGAAWTQPVTRQTTIIVGDISSSTASQRTIIEQWVSNALKNKPAQEQVGIVAVGHNALVEQAVGSHVDFTRFESAPETNYTDLAAGLRLASTLLPSNSRRHIVLLTDGQQNQGDALQEASLLQQQGIRLDVVPLPSSTSEDARIDDLTAPTEVHANERFTLHIKLFSTVAQHALLRLYLDQQLLVQQSVSLVSGQQESSVQLLAPPVGFHTFRVTLEAPHDAIQQNDLASTFVNVQGPPRVLVIEGNAGSGRNIISALQATGIGVTVQTPGALSTKLEDLAGYGSVVLADVPAAALGATRMELLQSYVRDLGRGLVVSGGQNSYGVGGYAQTPLEHMLPVSMDIPQHKDTPSLAVVLIIESLEASLPVNISKEAAKSVVGLLTPQDQVGISQANGTLVIPMQHVTNKAAINKAIDRMNPEDPESYTPDLSNAEQVLKKTTAQVKHVILLGDGDAFDNYAPLVLKMANEHITISTVGTNSGNAQELSTMVNIANWGKGRFYRADDPTVIPQVLLHETEQAARRSIVQEPFVPMRIRTHPLLTGLNALPELAGYVATTPKPTAQMILMSQRDDPVLAAWQYGLGRVVAWTSDAVGLWSTHWLTWKEAAHWWANLVTWTLPATESAMNIHGTVVNGTAQLIVDLPPTIQTENGSQQQVQAHIIAPSGSQEFVHLHLTAPQRWEGSFPTPQVGAYLLQLTRQEIPKGGQQPTKQLTATAGLVVPYSPEFRTLGTDMHFLQLLTRAGGGSLLSLHDSASTFTRPLAPVWVIEPIPFWLLTLAALLLPLDIAVRRLSSLAFLATASKRLRTHLKRIAPPHRILSSSSSTEHSLAATLLQAKRRYQHNDSATDADDDSISQPEEDHAPS